MEEGHKYKKKTKTKPVISFNKLVCHCFCTNVSQGDICLTEPTGKNTDPCYVFPQYNKDKVMGLKGLLETCGKTHLGISFG
jgi:hypothetical protein